MALEGSPADVAPGSAGASVSPAVLRDAIKHSLLEVLRENPSLLRPPEDAERPSGTDQGVRVSMRGLVQ